MSGCTTTAGSYEVIPVKHTFIEWLHWLKKMDFYKREDLKVHPCNCIYPHSLN